VSPPFASQWSFRTIQISLKIMNDVRVCRLFTSANLMHETKGCFAPFCLSRSVNEL
jgi:hypothetical protein